MRLGLGCRSTADLRLLRPALERLRQEEERILPMIRLIPLSALDNLLTEGDIQVLFTFQETAPQNSVYRELLRSPVVFVCREDHPLAQCETVTVEQLKEGGLIAACRPPLCPPVGVCPARADRHLQAPGGSHFLREPGGALHPGGDGVRLLHHGRLSPAACPAAALYPHPEV